MPPRMLLPLVLGTCLHPGLLHAQSAADAYPSRPVNVIVAIAPGGPIDIEARLFSNKMSSLMGQPFVVDYKPGAAGTIGAAYVAKARPDGYSLLVAGTGFAVFPAFYTSLPFDTLRDFSPVSLVSKRSAVVLANPSFPAKSLVEYFSYAKANPGTVNYGTSGAGTISHLAGEWMNSATNTSVTFVHYKGVGPLTLDLTSGRLNIASASLVAALPLIKSGKVRAMAIMDERRSRLLPDLPTVAEQGVPGFGYTNWLGFIAPAGTPDTVVRRLYDGFSRAAKATDIISIIEGDGGVTVGSTPEEFRTLIATETGRWKKLVQDRGIKAE